MRAIAFSIVAGCLFGAGAVDAQVETTLPGDAAPGQAVTAALELRIGERREGAARLEGDSLILTQPLSVDLRVGLDSLVGMEVKVSRKEPGQAEETNPGGRLPAPWHNIDIGRLVVPGKARWKNGQFLLHSSRRIETENFDAFHMVYMPIKGDGEIVARVVKVEDRGEGSYGGIVVCDGLHAESRKALLSVHAKGINFRRWGYQGGSSTGEDDPSIKPPYWLKLVREDKDVRAYYSPDGHRWRFLKNSPGKMPDEQVYVGLVARMTSLDRLGEVIIDRVSVNGVGNQPSEPLLPHVVLRSGSRLAADIEKADGTSFHFRGRWKDLVLTAPQVARVEFFHPLPEERMKMVQGDRAGLLLRSGDFSEGGFEAIAEGQVKLSSVLFGLSGHSILDEADSLVLRKVVQPTVGPVFRLETQAGSVLLAKKARLAGGKLVVEVAELGEVSFGLEEIRSLQSIEAP